MAFYPKYWLLVAWVVAALPLMAQRVKLYEGPFENDLGEQGRARYYYFEEQDGKKSLNGPFSFTVAYTDSLRPHVLIKKKYDGFYDKGLKDGQWNYDFKTYEVLLKDVEAFDLSYDINGSYLKVKGSYDRGYPTGPWQLREDQYAGSEPVGPLRRGAASFDDGHPIEEFFFESTIDTNRFRIDGQFDDEGRFDGRWELRYALDSLPVREVRQYTRGFLTELVRYNQATGARRDSLYYPDVVQNLQDLAGKSERRRAFAVSDSAFGVLFDHGYAPNSPPLARQRPGNAYLRRAAALFANVDAAIGELKGGLTRPFRPTRRFVYEVPDATDLVALTNQADTLRRLLNPLAGSKVLELNRERNDSLAYAYSLFDLAARRLSAIDSALAFAQTPAYRYSSPDVLLSSRLAFVSDPDTVRYAYRQSPNARVVDFETAAAGTSPLRRLSGYLRALRDSINPYAAYADRELVIIEQEGSNQALEAKIGDQLDTLTSLYRADSVRENALLAAVYQGVLVEQVRRLELDYSQTTDLRNRQQIGQELSALLDSAAVAYPLLRDLPALRAAVDSAYTEKTFDPYTFSYDFTRRRKKDLYQKGAVYLYNLLEQQMLSPPNPKALPSQARELARLLRQMLTLAEGKTRRLESQLRRTKDPAEIKEIIGLT